MKKHWICFAVAGLVGGCGGMRPSGSIPIIDTHIHLYDTTRPEGLPWPPPSDTVIYLI